MGKNKIIFRADGEKSIGMGHFIRTLALAEMLKNEFHCIYATQVPTEYQIHEIERVCHEWIKLPGDGKHFNVFLNYLKGDEIVVLDNYYFRTEYQRKIKAIGCKLVCIDDKHDKHYFADIVINHAEGISSLLFSAEKDTRFLLGYKYALLRNEYLQDQKIKPKKKYSCLIMMGGSDPHNLTVKMISSLGNLSLRIAVVVGDGYILEKEIIKFGNVYLFKGIPSKKVKQLMQESDFGILPASTVAIEACAARLPFICGYFIDNQKDIYYGIKNDELAVCVGDFLELDRVKLISAINLVGNPIISANIRRKQIEKLDKKSKERFLKEFQAL